MTPIFFPTPYTFRKWLQKNHEKETELLVGFYKVGSGKPSISWSQAVDEALCFGWIDGVRTSIDGESYKIRFTQRKPNSIWSAINISKVEKLVKEGRMQPAGIAAFKKRTDTKSKVYSYEREPASLPLSFEKQFKVNKKAWAYFNSLATSYQKNSIHWVTSARQEATQLKRLHQLITDSENETNQWKNNKYDKK